MSFVTNLFIKSVDSKEKNEVVNVNNYIINMTLNIDIVQQIKDSEKKKTTKKKKSKQKKKYLGMFKIYSYCPCSKCCSHNTGITKSGTKAKQGRTIAVDTSVIPLGSTVYIKYGGKVHKFIAEDTGSGIKGKKIDKFMNNHSEALKWGIKECKVWVKLKNK